MLSAHSAVRMRTTVSLDDDLAAHVDEARPSDDASDAEAVRECVRRSQRLDGVESELEDIRQELEHRDAKIDDLYRQLAAVRQHEDQTQELVEYVEDERTYRSAGITTRMKWWLFGMPSEDGEA